MQLEFFDVPSPCVGICQSNAKGYCLGCMRTRDERQDWINLDNDNKQKVIKRCIQRKKRQQNKYKPKAVEEINLLEIEHESEQPSLLEPPIKPRVIHDSDLDFGDFEL
ncbi:DUF1289 domain-containing protein [Candidatus Colwellia aromaticivorans]|uniref:DUF1289 domain-containing protein n=1 Tax=Candidatus Colwellia aromaticivorans TaxID=2267621 RepID=UPI000DF3DE8C|nr:DUF1289 domain-containing protein [Candidatus Colwellia aromaticivorans]